MRLHRKPRSAAIQNFLWIASRRALSATVFKRDQKPTLTACKREFHLPSRPDALGNFL